LIRSTKVANISERILDKAKQLFNEKGYKKVSLRDIAEAAGTTIGNLTYHFPKKEDLVSTIQLELYTDFFNINFDMGNGQLLFEEILRSLLIMDMNRDNNIFFYKNIVDLCHESTIITKNVEDFRNRIYHFFLSCFFKLQEHELMRPDISQTHYEILSYTITCMTYVWRQDTTLYYDKSIPRVELHDAIKNLLYPYLTTKGIELYKAISKSE